MRKVREEKERIYNKRREGYKEIILKRVKK